MFRPWSDVIKEPRPASRCGTATTAAGAGGGRARPRRRLPDRRAATVQAWAASTRPRCSRPRRGVIVAYDGDDHAGDGERPLGRGGHARRGGRRDGRGSHGRRVGGAVTVAATTASPGRAPCSWRATTASRSTNVSATTASSGGRPGCGRGLSRRSEGRRFDLSVGPVNAGGRRSRNEATPSRWSSDSKHACITARRSTLRCVVHGSFEALVDELLERGADGQRRSDEVAAGFGGGAASRRSSGLGTT